MTATGRASLDTALAAAVERIEETGWAAEICDAEWRLVWVSSQMRAIFGGADDEALGVGKHLLESRVARAWMGLSDAFTETWVRDNVPLLIEHTPGGKEALREMVEPVHRPIIDELEPVSAPAWTSLLDFNGEPIEVGTVRCFGVRPRDRTGQPMGAIFLYGSSLPATILALVARGNPRLFERMARLVQPGRRKAALLFADLQASGSLSRRLPSASYFTLIRELTTLMDEAIIEECGIVGKHAGDGATGFFLTDDAGSPSAAAARCIAAARRICAGAGDIADRMSGVEPADVRINVGLHWGGTLYMGQVVTGGRLEVTALGDEVNEAARLQQAARDGTLLASKSLIEHLEPEDAERSGVEPDGLTYRALAEIAGVSEKIVRDAGTLAVASI